MRIAVGGFMHETNTFVARPTTWDDFARDGAWPGAKTGREMFAALQGLNFAASHFMEAVQRARHTVVPLAWAAAMPSGRVTDDAFEWMSAILCEGIDRERPDAVFLELHGAMATESFDDAEGELLRQVRQVAGPRVPIIVALDLHANVSELMVACADFISSFRTYPHTDRGVAGTRCFDWLPRVLSWKTGPARAFGQLPFLIPITAGCTILEPAHALYEELKMIEADTGVHLSLNMGFPAADVSDVGPSVIAYGREQELVDEAASRLYAAVIEAEPEFAAHRAMPVVEAVVEAMGIARRVSRPVILADTQDNPGAGAPATTTGVIDELLRQGAERALVGIVHDPIAAGEAHAAGVGGQVSSLGGEGEGPGQVPIAGPWRVVALSNGRYGGPSATLRASDTVMGPTALLAKDGVEVLVSSIRQQPIHREAFTHLGIDLQSRSIIALKSSVHFRAGFQAIAEKVIVCAAPGVNLDDPSGFAYTKIRPDVRLKPGEP
jgi:microcystin degradation protein MlrC